MDLTCPICFIELNEDISVDPPLTCCGKRIHYSCIGKCESSSNYNTVGKCPLCRQELDLDGLVSKNKYNNLKRKVNNSESIEEYRNVSYVSPTYYRHRNSSSGHYLPLRETCILSKIGYTILSSIMPAILGVVILQIAFAMKRD